MKTLLLSCLLFASSAASADVCKPSGDPILTIEHDVVAGVKKPTSVTKLYANGAWTFAETDPDGKSGRSANGCLGKDDITRVKTALDAAPWTITHPKVHCMAMGQTFTVWTAGAKTWTEKMCGTDLLDEKTKGALDDAEKTINVAVPAKK